MRKYAAHLYNQKGQTRNFMLSQHTAPGQSMGTLALDINLIQLLLLLLLLCPGTWPDTRCSC
jgi:hypothetical protein